MPTKAQKEKELNEMLGTNIEWSRLLEDDIEELEGAIHSGSLVESILKYMAKEKGKDAVEEQVDEWYPGKLLGGLI